VAANRAASTTIALIGVNAAIALVTIFFVPISDGHDHRLPYERWMWIAFGVVAAVQLCAAVAAIASGSRAKRTKVIVLGALGVLVALPSIGFAVLVTTVGAAG
jgi:quinol-cytochrome oxidoreductase complex cytochrome b subunit